MNDTKDKPSILQKMCNALVPFCNPEDEIDFDSKRKKD